MAEANNYTFGFKELAEILVRDQNIKEGLWGIYIEFGLGAANINTDPSSGTKVLAPAAINVVQKIGIQKFPEPSNLTVDAAKINPPKPSTSSKRAEKRAK